MSKIAVIYWSGTGNTQQMAEAIANQAHADLFTASEFTADKAANYDAFAFGCSAMGAEQLEEDEFEPMWNAVAPVLGSKKVVLFGSCGYRGAYYDPYYYRNYSYSDSGIYSGQSQSQTDSVTDSGSWY